MPDPATDHAGLHDLTPRDITQAAREIRAVTDTTTIKANADRIKGLTQGIKEGKRMSLAGKMAALTERAQDFHKKTEEVLDGIMAKVDVAEKKRDRAADRHHDHYDKIIDGIDESVAVIDRLSNDPLGEGGEG